MEGAHISKYKNVDATKKGECVQDGEKDDHHVDWRQISLVWIEF